MTVVWDLEKGTKVVKQGYDFKIVWCYNTQRYLNKTK